jgi:dihydroflavonol-4-reductase
MDDGYSTTKHLAEDVARAAAAELDVVIVNPTYMLGPYDPKPTSGRLIVQVVRGRIPGVSTGANNFVDVRDVARGMILAWKKGVRGERYILGGENLPFTEIFARIARVAGVKPPTRRVPQSFMRVVGRLGDAWEKVSGREPLLNSVAVAYAYCTTFQFSSDKAKRELGYAVSPLEPAIADAIAWFREVGIL